MKPSHLLSDKKTQFLLVLLDLRGSFLWMCISSISRGVMISKSGTGRIRLMSGLDIQR